MFTPNGASPLPLSLSVSMETKQLQLRGRGQSPIEQQKLHIAPGRSAIDSVEGPLFHLQVLEAEKEKRQTGSSRWSYKVLFPLSSPLAPLKVEKQQHR